MSNIRCLDEYKEILLACKGCNSVECICAGLQLGDMVAHDWLNDIDCTGVCHTCWFVHGCIGMDNAIPLHLLQEEVILLEEDALLLEYAIPTHLLF
jgi:hypothetical protein